MKVIERWDRVSSLGDAVFVVHDSAEVVRSTLLHDLDVPFSVLVDLDRTAYGAWGLGRLPGWRIFGDPRVWRRYVDFFLRREKFLPWGRDVLQMGGDFVVDAQGTVTYARPQRADDRPPVGVLVAELEAAARM